MSLFNRELQMVSDDQVVFEAIKPILMPKWGLAMTEGTLVAWHVAEGTRVEAGADLCDIETTKITNVFEAPVSGILARQMVAPGSVVPVGALIGIVTEGAVPSQDIDTFVAGFRPVESGETDSDTGDAVLGTLRLADGGEIAFRSQGDGDDMVLMVHGFGGDSANWTYLQPYLSTDRRTVALDLPGHGRSTKALGPDPIGRLVDAVDAVASHFSPTRLHLVGHSLGGAIAILAAKKLDRLVSLSLIAPCGLGPEINMGFIEGLIAAERRKDIEPILAQLFTDPSLVSRQMINDILKYKRIEGVLETLRSLATAAFPKGRQGADLRSALARLAVPVQVIWGGDDHILPISQGAGLPDCINIHYLSGVGHMPQVEKPEKVAEIIVRFLK
jgi:pyruvate dehydrogenase E2 component (dihydrolipoamide acetyltransferase)